NTAGLATGDYSGTITLRATDANGRSLTGEKISVGLHILAPCTFTISGSQLNFTATVGSPNPSAQTVTLTASSGCSQQVKWQVSGPDAWVMPTPNQATINGGGSGTLSVGLNITTLVAQSYTSTINITATDTANGQSLGSIPITINLLVQAASVTGTSTPTVNKTQTPTTSSTPVSWMLLAREDPNQGF
ncbi:MAG TPA: hypothetical protein VFN23_13760, partial [Ktedonobacteraceae bacterium]|nr:hypothetical protein [Ktedonobacteraceae bacterium]